MPQSHVAGSRSDSAQGRIHVPPGSFSVGRMARQAGAPGKEQVIGHRLTGYVHLDPRNGHLACHTALVGGFDSSPEFSAVTCPACMQTDLYKHLVAQHRQWQDRKWAIATQIFHSNSETFEPWGSRESIVIEPRDFTIMWAKWWGCCSCHARIESPNAHLLHWTDDQTEAHRMTHDYAHSKALHLRLVHGQECHVENLGPKPHILRLGG